MIDRGTRSGLLVAGSALLLAGCNAAGGTEPPAGPAQSRYAAVAVGRVDSLDEARQLVAAVDGVIEHLLVQRGDVVRAGQPLLTVACAPRLAAASASSAGAEQAAANAQTVALGSRSEAVSAARQAAAAARAARDEAADWLAQARSLLAQGFVSRREYSAREHALAGAEAELAKAQAQADLLASGPRSSERHAARASARAAAADALGAQASAAQCTLLSPISGTVLQVLHREGEFSGASQGTPLLVVGDLSQRIVRAEISERDAAKLALGQVAEIWIEGEQQRWRGRVTSLSSVMGRRSARSLDPTDRFDRDTREAVISFDGPAPPALVGLRVMVGIVR